MPDPFTRPGARPNLLNRQIPVADFILPGTIEWQLDRVYKLATQIDAARREKEPAQRVRGPREPARCGDQAESRRARTTLAVNTRPC